MQRKENAGKLKGFKTFLQEEEGMGTVEIILIIGRFNRFGYYLQDTVTVFGKYRI